MVLGSGEDGLKIYSDTTCFAYSFYTRGKKKVQKQYVYNFFFLKKKEKLDSNQTELSNKSHMLTNDKRQSMHDLY